MRPETFLATAHALADAAGEIARRYFRQPLTVITKADDSPVTVADREIETELSELLLARHPGHGLFGEEHGSRKLDAEWIWVIDPIDGTKSFVTGKPMFGTLIALLHHGVPVLGVIDQPILRERWVGVQGQATTCNGVAVRVRPPKSLADTLLVCTTPGMIVGVENNAAFDRLRVLTKGVTWGGDCYSYAMLANGFVDAVVEADLKPYDYLALVPVIEGAGGWISDWSGAPLGLHSDGRVVALAERGAAEMVCKVLSWR